jgi:hypothetical protein
METFVKSIMLTLEKRVGFSESPGAEENVQPL